MIEDYLLVRRLRSGDPQALVRIYEKYKDDLVSVAMCLVGDLASAEDCLHDVFVSLAAKARELQIRSHLKAYLTAWIANRAKDHLRSRSRQGVLVGEFPDAPAADPDPQAAGENGEMNDRLLVALGKLPWEQREIIALHLRGGMTFRRIADLQGQSINTIQSRYRYGIEKLRTLLGTGARS